MGENVQSHWPSCGCLVELNGAFVHPQGPIDPLEWDYDPQVRGFFVRDWAISDGDAAWPIDEIFGTEEVARTERAFRDTFTETVRGIGARFSHCRTANGAWAMVRRGERDARDSRLQQKRRDEVGLPCGSPPEYPGEVVCRLGYWKRWSQARARHHAWAFVRQDWTYLDGAVDYRAYRPGYCPSDYSFRAFRNIVLTPWRVAVEAWQAAPHDQKPPPRPIGRRAGTLDLVA